MNTQVPIGSDAHYCPFWQKKMSEVCHKCPMWVLVRGKDPQSEQEFNEWRCAFAWMPTMTLEAAQQSRQAGASADKVANEIQEFHKSMVTLNRVAITLEEQRHQNRLEDAKTGTEQKWISNG